MSRIDLIVSFSGGRTSAFMSWWLKKNMSHIFKLHFVFANTGQEHEKTLEFVEACDKHFDLGVAWIEAETHFNKRVGCTHIMTDFDHADRTGKVYEKVIQKYGIPNKAYPHCNRELKLNPIKDWMKSNDLKLAHSAVGIRVDEFDRMSIKADANNIVYPLVSWNPTTKDDVANFWGEQDFDLGLLEEEGNCVWCWKKSDKKLYSLARRNPEFFDFPKYCEDNYGLHGHNVDGTQRKFFREHKSTDDIITTAVLGSVGSDVSNGCSETCDVFTADTDDGEN